jgi:hypothetical protein
MLSACTPKVLLMVPPSFDLAAYDKVGLIDFTCDDHSMRKIGTQQFQQAIQAAQPGVRVLELGSENRVLRSVRYDDLDVEAIRAIGEMYQVDALIVGRLEIEQMAPRFQVSTSLTEMTARADVEASIQARLIETASGATVWTNSARGAINVAHASVDSGGIGNFGMSDAQGTYTKLVEGLVTRMTADFRAHYLRKRPEDIPLGYRLTYPNGVAVYVPPSADR